jgi:hypothetical protein
MRKLCTAEVRGVKMKKKHILQFEKTYFLYCSFWAAPLALHSKDGL